MVLLAVVSTLGTAGAEIAPAELVGSLLRQMRRPDVAATMHKHAAEHGGTLVDFFDVGAMARQALTERWPALDPEQRRRYLLAYRRLLERVVARYVDTAQSRSASVVGTRRAGAIEIVVTRFVSPQRGERDLYWYVRPTPKPLIVDFVFEGTRFTDYQRAEFDRMLQASSGDFTALLTAIDGMRP